MIVAAVSSSLSARAPADRSLFRRRTSVYRRSLPKEREATGQSEGSSFDVARQRVVRQVHDVDFHDTTVDGDLELATDDYEPGV
jgi:hypothetical protein